jgi:aminoglycoside-2''-adenylyltransferase
VDRILAAASQEYWLFGGWAVDFHAGRITRPHGDVDVAVWLADVPRIAAVLGDAGWRHAPDPEEDGGTGYERGGVRLELTYLVRRADGSVVTPLRDFEATWPDGAFGAETRELEGIRARLVSLDALASGKSSARDDPDDAAKDRADFDVLSGLGRGRDR